MTGFWESLRMLMFTRFMRRKPSRSVPILDPRTLNAYWLRDLGFDV